MDATEWFLCRKIPINIIAINPENGIGKASSSVTRINATLSRIKIFTVSRIWFFLKKIANPLPNNAPHIMPVRMDSGIFTKLNIFILSPWAKPRNAVNITITKTSSTLAPAKINWGILSFVPYPSSISCNIFGTITAGLTAATTLPIMAASNKEIPSNFGANKIIPIISKQAGTKHINIAGLPTLFKSLKSKFNPALINIIINAIFLNSLEIFNRDESIKPRQ